MRTLPLLLLLAAAPASAQTPHRWSARAAAEVEMLEGDRGTWHQQSVALGRRFSHANFVLEGGQVVRYGESDPYGAVEAYPFIADKTYGYARLRLAPNATVSPRTDGHVEVFRNVGGGLEVSLGARGMIFATTSVALVTSSATLDRGPWRYVARGAYVPKDQIGGGSAQLRRTFRDEASRFAEVLVGAGREYVATGAETLEIRTTRTALARVSVPVGHRAAVQAMLGATHESGFTRGTFGLATEMKF